MRGIEIEDLYKFYSLGNITWSPDGERGIFLKWNVKKETNNYDGKLWMIEAGQAVELGDTGCTGLMCWLDSSKLLFSAFETADEAYFRTVDLGTGELAYAFILEKKPLKINAAAGGLFVIQTVCENQPADEDCLIIDEIPYQSNGRGFINKARRQIQIFDPEKRTLIPVTEPQFESNLWEVSNDGTKILYTGITPDGISHRYDGLYLYDISSGKTDCLIAEGRYRIDAAAFASGYIAIAASDQNCYGMDQNPVIYRLDYDGQLREEAFWDGPVTGSSVNSDVRYGKGTIFLADGKTIYFVTTYWDRSLFCGVRDGHVKAYCEWKENPEFIAVQNGRCLMIASKEQQLQEIFEVNLTGKFEEEPDMIRQITHFSNESLCDLSISKPQQLDFEDACGNQIQGWVLLPGDYDPDKKYPALLEIHGGPKTAYGSVFHHEMQMFASAGYVVFFCNPPGSDGRGDEFADIRGCYGKRDYETIMTFTDHVLKCYPCIDRHRIGVTGGSYGGFMVNWLIGHTDRFAAAVSQRSMANMITLRTTTDIGHYSVWDHQRADISQNFDLLWQQSPLKYAFRAVTPTLFLHADEDHRCWQVEAMQMFSELKLHGVETRLCIFKQENHELSRTGRPSSRIKRLKEMRNWMDSYLKNQ